MIGPGSIERGGSHGFADDELVIRSGTVCDIAAIKQIADRDKYALGFVHRGSLVHAAERGELIVASISLSVTGFCQFYRRRDGIVTVYHVAVAPEVRKVGIGRALLTHVHQDAVERGMTAVRLKCPADLSANQFYSHIGYVLVEIEGKNARCLNIWELPLSEERLAILQPVEPEHEQYLSKPG